MIQHIAPEALPDYVKSAGIDDLGVSADVPPNGFAYRLHGNPLLPCHNKAAAFVSRLYFELQRDQVDSTTARQIDAKLAGFERMFAIDPEEIKTAVNDLARVNAELPAQQQANKLACQYGMQPDSIPVETLIGAARELKTAGANNMLINDWSFDRPLLNASREVRKLANLYQCDRMAELANELGKVSPRRAVEFIPKLASLLADRLTIVKPYAMHDREVLSQGRETVRVGRSVGKSLTSHSKLAGVFGSSIPVNLQVQRILSQLPTVDHPAIRLCDHEIDPRRILPHLPKIASLTGMPLISDMLQLPVNGWEQMLDDAPVETKRTILDNVTL
ncbi:MAG: hypothetical protein B7Z37_25595 [Verrucomicrobia bacterium 12-59-8]|nr:MAG: hypothetical protein B7Z37_25595 [Verrucomicrobia bacterium 12-59-8]